jgi:hypothetical protein
VLYSEVAGVSALEVTYGNSFSMSAQVEYASGADVGVPTCVKCCVPVTADQSKWTRLVVEPGHAVLANDEDVQTVRVLVFDKWGNPVPISTALVSFKLQGGNAGLLNATSLLVPDPVGVVSRAYRTAVEGSYDVAATWDGYRIPIIKDGVQFYGDDSERAVSMVYVDSLMSEQQSTIRFDPDPDPGKPGFVPILPGTTVKMVLELRDSMGNAALDVAVEDLVLVNGQPGTTPIGTCVEGPIGVNDTPGELLCSVSATPVQTGPGVYEWVLYSEETKLQGYWPGVTYGNSFSIYAQKPLAAGVQQP